MPSGVVEVNRSYNTHMANPSDIVVIGGGIIGLTSAYFLAKAGVRVEVIDRQELGREASWAGAGIIPPGNPARARSAADKLRALSVSRFAAFSAELRELTGIDNGYVRCGGIEILDESDADDVARWEAEGLVTVPLLPGRCGMISEGVLGIPPPVREREARYYLPDFAQVRNPWHLRALIAACERVGVKLSPNTPFHPQSILPDRHYLLAAGAWAGELLKSFGVELPVQPVRGQIVLFRCERPPFTPIIMHGKRYLVPRPDGRVLAGSTEEPGAGFEKATTTEGVEELKQFAFDHCSALRSADVEKTWAGLRPGSPDGLPFIGPVSGVPNLFAAVGHFRTGVQLSLGTAELVSHGLLNTSTDIPLDSFRLDREPDMTARPAFRS
jgi:glycine oxidase